MRKIIAEPNFKIFLPVGRISDFMMGVVKCSRDDVYKIQGEVPISSATLWSEKVPSINNSECRKCAKCFNAGDEAVITEEGVLCRHPNVGMNYKTAHDLAVLMFHENDPVCLNCLLCKCPKTFMKPFSERPFLDVSEMYKPESELCGELGCSVKEECFTLVITGSI